MHIGASDGQRRRPGTFKNGGATILVATAFAPNYDAKGQFSTPVVLNGPLTVSCPGAGAKVFVSGYK